MIESVRIGGTDKSTLVSKLLCQDVQINEAAATLLESDVLSTAPEPSILSVTVLTPKDFGLDEGGTIDEIYNAAILRGLALCPLELALQMRLQYHDQPEGSEGRPETHGEAPPGSLTIASEWPDAGDDFPRGFYLRKINGKLSLRGFRAARNHRWNAGDHFVFVRPDKARE